MALREDYRDDILDTSKNTKRKYNMLSNADGTVSLEDVTEYTQNGDDFSANDVNSITKALNETQEEVFENLIHFPYDDGSYIKHKEVEYVVDENGIVTVNGTATGGNSNFFIANGTDTATPISLKKGTYSLCGCPKGGSATTYRIALGYVDNSGTYNSLVYDPGEGVTFTIDADMDNIQIRIFIQKGTVCENLAFKPMLVKGSTIPKEYKSYSQGKVTRAELDEKLENFSGGGGDGTVRYVNDTADENYDWIQVKKADGTWENWERGNLDQYVLYEYAYNGGGFEAYAGGIRNGGALAVLPNVNFVDTMNISLTANSAGTPEGSVISKLIDLSDYDTITLEHSSTLTGNNEGNFSMLFVTNEKADKMDVLASTYIISRGVVGTNTDTVTLDVSSINSKCYIGICLLLNHNDSGSVSISTNVHSIKLS